MSLVKSWVCVAGLLAGMAFSVLAGEFAAPAEGPVAFRRDGVPLDPDAMVGLSRLLGGMANSLKGETPVERRAAAQMIALALALDPANRRARELITEYQEGRHKPDEDLERLAKNQARVWQNIAWLETTEAGPQGQALAACLKDVIVVSDPQNPKSAALREGGEKGAWKGWVPDVSAYDKPSVAQHEDPKPEDPKPPSVEKNPVALESARVQTLLWQKVGEKDQEKWALALLPLEMSVRKSVDESGQPNAFSVRVGPGGEGDTLGQIGYNVRKLLQGKYGSLPAGVRISITSRQLEKSLESHKMHSISGASAVLANAAISGREPEGIILGTVDEHGNYKLPTGFWDQLQSLGKGTGQRLIVPAAAASVLPSMLALERPGFFMEYEVLMAADFKQLLDVSAKNPEGELSAAIAKFREIRERSGTQDVRQYIGNTFVKQRLMAVYQEEPSHFSAKMLLTQAAGNRPTLVARAVLAAEIRRALEPMKSIVRNEYDSLGSSEISKLGQMFESCRGQVDALERYAEKADRPLIERARELLGAIRNVERATRTRGESYMVESAVYSARSELNRLYRSVTEELAKETGEPGNR